MQLPFSDVVCTRPRQELVAFWLRTVLHSSNSWQEVYFTLRAGSSTRPINDRWCTSGSELVTTAPPGPQTSFRDAPSWAAQSPEHVQLVCGQWFCRTDCIKSGECGVRWYYSFLGTSYFVRATPLSSFVSRWSCTQSTAGSTECSWLHRSGRNRLVSAGDLTARILYSPLYIEGVHVCLCVWGGEGRGIPFT